RLGVRLPTAITVGSLLTITSVTVRQEDDDRLLLELGTQVSGEGDLHVTGLPDLIRVGIDTVRETVDFALGRSGESLTLLVPGVVYASGTLQTGSDAARALGGDTTAWQQLMVGSLRAFLVGNGTASAPADHLSKSSYLFDLEIGLISAVHRTDGTTAVVLT